jgi:hypothetical protein
MEIEIEQLITESENTSTGRLKAKRGLWALVSAFHGRTAIVEAGIDDNVKTAVDDALSRVGDRYESTAIGRFVCAVVYVDNANPHRLDYFVQKVKRKLDVREDSPGTYQNPGRNINRRSVS